MLKAFVALLLCTLVIVGTAWYMSRQAEKQQQLAEDKERVESGFLETRQELNDKMEEYQRRKTEVQDNIVRFEKLKKDTTEELRQSGVKTAEDLDNNPDAKRKYQSIRRYMQDIEKLNGDIKLFDDAISAIESGLRELDRKILLEEVGVNDEAYRQLRTVVKEIDDRLAKPESALEELETQQMLDEILGPRNSADAGQ